MCFKFDFLGCEDADECAVEGSCDQLCTNTNGSFSCECISGYQKDSQRCHAINGLKFFFLEPPK